jgi:GNAT superfamily N-acetyltransferase
VLLAYDGGRVVGFARTARHGMLREIETLGVVPAARGRGLGRALLHWGIAELQREATDEVTLMVEGETRTRSVSTRPRDSPSCARAGCGPARWTSREVPPRHEAADASGLIRTRRVSARA